MSDKFSLAHHLKENRLAADLAAAEELLFTPIPLITMAEVFHKLSEITWLGYKIQKNPLDLWNYQSLLYDLKPDILIECGTWHGGSALFFSNIMDCVCHGNIFTIDTWKWPLRPQHPRITYVDGSSVDPDIVEAIRTYTCQVHRVMVILDSDHTKAHVLKELDFWAPHVTVGQYLVVEDTNIHGHPIRTDLPEGPWEAVHEWLPDHPEFVIDHNLECLGTASPDGWLRRVT
jgi:cephalosporin hydroxylase